MNYITIEFLTIFEILNIISNLLMLKPDDLMKMSTTQANLAIVFKKIMILLILFIFSILFLNLNKNY